MKIRNLSFGFMISALVCSLPSFGQWQIVGTPGFTGNSVASPSMTIIGDTPVIGYRDNGFNGGKATVQMYVNNAWTDIGLGGFSINAVSEVSMASDSATGTPYIAYIDTALGFTVSQYDGFAWAYLGLSGFYGAGDQISLVIAGNGTVYIGYRDTLTKKANMQMFTSGSGWSQLGAANFSSAGGNVVAFAVDHFGVPYAATSLNNGGGIQVQKYNGSSWVTVGNTGFDTAYLSTKISIAIGANNEPYVALTSQNSPYAADVWTFNGTSWTNGNASTNTTNAKYVSIAVTNLGAPVLSYVDNNSGSKASVSVFNGSSWAPLGTADFSSGGIATPSLALSNNGTVYVGYVDLANGNAATVETHSAPGAPANSINEVSGLASFKLYPNPTDGQFQISYQSIKTGDVVLSATDMLGQTVWQQTSTAGSEAISVDLSSVAKGLYVLQVIAPEGSAKQLVEIK